MIPGLLAQSWKDDAWVVEPVTEWCIDCWALWILTFGSVMCKLEMPAHKWSQVYITIVHYAGRRGNVSQLAGIVCIEFLFCQPSLETIINF